MTQLPTRLLSLWIFTLSFLTAPTSPRPYRGQVFPKTTALEEGKCLLKEQLPLASEIIGNIDFFCTTFLYFLSVLYENCFSRKEFNKLYILNFP